MYILVFGTGRDGWTDARMGWLDFPSGCPSATGKSPGSSQQPPRRLHVLWCLVPREPISLSLGRGPCAGPPHSGRPLGFPHAAPTVPTSHPPSFFHCPFSFSLKSQIKGQVLLNPRESRSALLRPHTLYLLHSSPSHVVS